MRILKRCLFILRRCLATKFEVGFFMYLSSRNLISKIVLFSLLLNSTAALFAVEGCGAENPNSAKQQTIYSRISEMYLHSVSFEDSKEQEDMKKLQEENDKVFSELASGKYKDIKVPAVGDVERLKLIYKLFHERSLNQNNVIGDNSSTFKDNVFSDLQIYCGSNSDLKHHIFGVIDNTVTSFGKVELQRFLYQNIESVGPLRYEVSRRQAIVKYLVQHPALREEIEQQLQIVKQGESDLLWFWKSMDFSLQKMMKMFYMEGFLSMFNESTGFLEYNALQQTVVAPAMISVVDFIYVWLAAAMVHKSLDLDNPMLTLGALGYATLMIFGSYMMMSFVLGIVKTYNGMTNDFQGKLMSVARITETAESLSKILASDAELPILWDSHKALKVKAENAEYARDFKNLLDKLGSSTFKGEPSYFSNKGRVLATLQKLLRLRDNYISSLKSIGEIDAYLSIAKLYVKHQASKNATYCFPEFVQSDKPVIDAKGFWHPFVDANKVVTNDIELGGDAITHNIVLTGPNAAGKSTFLKALTVSLIFAQSFGIAPASSLKMTPFLKINTYLNIADEEGRESLYQAEMRRAQELLNSMKQLKNGEFGFVIMDEIFTGTNPKEGTAGAYGIAKCIANYPSCICIIATHYKKLTDLEKDTSGYYKNYKVYVDIDSDGVITYPYKVLPGISDQTIALLLLEKQGFDREILDAAYDAIKA
jgi:DNA mismatch repair protein MutS